MGIHKDELDAKLWAEYNNGRMPVSIRVAYATYFMWMDKDEEFNDEVELAETGAQYQGLKFIFDNWCKAPVIETRERLHGE